MLKPIRKILGPVIMPTPLGALYGKWSARRHFHRACRLYAQLIRPGDLVFDVGAYIGERSAIFLHLGARVVAIEPQASSCAQLARRFSAAPRFHLVPKALSSSSGEKVLHLASFPMMSSLEADWLAAGSRARVIGTQMATVTTMDALIAEHGRPAFVKIDVEGHELCVLRGLSQALPGLSIEFIPARLQAAVDCIQHLLAFGKWEGNYSLGNTMRWSLANWVHLVEIVPRIKADPDSRHHSYGDIYARFCG
jgi:FkbM family methyltransferase